MVTQLEMSPHQLEMEPMSAAVMHGIKRGEFNQRRARHLQIYKSDESIAAAQDILSANTSEEDAHAVDKNL
jgi:hypothetical protein